MLCPRDRSSDPDKAGRPGRAGGHGCCCTALAAMMVVSLSGPWSGPQASPALQRDTSKMVRGPAQQPLQDFPLRTPLTRGATALPFGFSAFFMYSFSLLLLSLGGGWGVTFSLSLIDTKQNFSLPTVRVAILSRTRIGGKGRLCSQHRLLEL